MSRAKLCVHCGEPDTWNLFCSPQCELDFWRPRRHGVVATEGRDRAKVISIEPLSPWLARLFEAAASCDPAEVNS